MFGCVSRVAGRTVLAFVNRRSKAYARRATLHSSPSTLHSSRSTLHSSLFTLHSSGFTLIELLIVTVVIVTLMGIVFRLAGAGGDQRAKATTLARMQRIENAISGYYAAYGSYPPVPLQGRSRDINVRVDENGVQGPPTATSSVSLSNPSEDMLKQIDAACRAQPVAVLFPFFMSDVNAQKKSDAEQLVDLVASQDGNAQFSSLRSIGALDLDKSDWHEIELFQFGLMSFLLPRYQFMLQGDKEFYDHTMGGSAKRIGQWAANNQLPCRPDTGRTYDSWESIQKYLYQSGSGNPEAAIIETIGSQAVCARWMPNFEGIVTGGLTFFGVDTSDDDRRYLNGKTFTGLPKENAWRRQFSTGGFDSNTALYLLNGMTVVDGWGNEFYYCSEQPYQSYRLWSAGPDRRTFPPWYDLNSFSSSERTKIAGWTKDDLTHLAN